MAYVPDVDLDFQKYIAYRRGVIEKRHEEGSAFAYSGEQRVRKTMSIAKPVTLAVEATVRLWQGIKRAELLGSAVKVTEQQFPRVWQLTMKCARTLGISPPPVYVAPDVGSLSAHTLGTEDDACIVLNGALVDHLSDEELAFVIGHECGHISGGHVLFSTALYYLTASASFYVRWIVQPAILALRAWARRAEITCDRAGLLCVNNLDVAVAATVKLALGSQKLYKDLKMDEYLQQLDEGKKSAGRFLEIFRSHPYVPKRIEALRIFARTELFRRHAGLGDDGIPTHEADLQVSRLISVL